MTLRVTPWYRRNVDNLIVGSELEDKFDVFMVGGQVRLEGDIFSVVIPFGVVPKALRIMLVSKASLELRKVVRGGVSSSLPP